LLSFFQEARGFAKEFQGIQSITEFQVLGLPRLVAMLIDDLKDVEEGTPFDLLQPVNAGFLNGLYHGLAKMAQGFLPVVDLQMPLQNCAMAF
jgi:hypothetical protein